MRRDLCDDDQRLRSFNPFEERLEEGGNNCDGRQNSQPGLPGPASGIQQRNPNRCIDGQAEGDRQCPASSRQPEPEDAQQGHSWTNGHEPERNQRPQRRLPILKGSQRHRKSRKNQHPWPNPAFPVPTFPVQGIASRLVISRIFASGLV